VLISQIVLDYLIQTETLDIVNPFFTYSMCMFASNLSLAAQVCFKALKESSELKKRLVQAASRGDISSA